MQICSTPHGAQIQEMANIGISKSSYFTDVSVSKFAKQVEISTKKMASGKTNVTTGNQVAYDAMHDSFKIDLAGKNAAIKSMSVTQGYLATTVSVLDNASDILARIYDLAVMAANGTNTEADNAAIDMEAEHLADQFHQLISTAQYKGIKIFNDTPNRLVMAADGSGSEINFGIGNMEYSGIQFGAGNLEYDSVYDYTNPGIDTTEPGIRYEITDDLTETEKDVILSQTTGLSRDQLTVGSKFTTVGSSEESSSGLNVKDRFYVDGDGSVPFDNLGIVESDENFSGGSLELKFTNNGQASDDLTLTAGDGSAGTITINAGVVSYINDENQSIEIGEISSDGQDGSALKIDFYEKVSSNFLNGDFTDGTTNPNDDAVVNWSATEQRINFGNTFQVNGIDIPTPTDADMQSFSLVDVAHPSNDLGGQTPAITDNANATVGEYVASHTVYTQENPRNPYFSLITGNGALGNVDPFSFTDEAGGILHGPAIVSDANYLNEGDVVKMDYKANIFNSVRGDWYHFAAYLVDENDEITMMIGEYGKTTEGWRTASVDVQKAGNYRLVVVNGSWDQNQDRSAGADINIDDVRVETQLTITDEIAQSVLRSVNYSSSSDNQESVKDLLVTLENSNGDVSLTDDPQIYNVLSSDFNGKVRVAPTNNLENAVSLGASNNLGPNGTTKTSVVTSNIEAVQLKINNARVHAGAKYTVIESAIDMATDMRTQFALASGTLSDINFSLESAYLAKRQMMENAAAALLAQSNRAQEGLLVLV